MSSRAALLADQILETKGLTARYLAGFNSVNHVRQTPDLPNHVAWCLGHMALTMHRVALLIKGVHWTPPEPPPPQPGTLSHPSIPTPFAPHDFVTGDGTAGSREKGWFDTEAVAFRSTPEERHDRFPTLERCIVIFNTAADTLAEAVRNLDDHRLDQKVVWGQGEQTIWALLTRMVFHNGFHTGQIADLRRALGLKRIMG